MEWLPVLNLLLIFNHNKRTYEPKLYPLFPNASKLCEMTSVQFSRSVVSNCLQPHESQHARPPCPLPTPGVHSDSHPSSQGCHLILCCPLLLLPQSLPASESFPMSQLFAWGGQRTASASFPPKKSQGWSPLEWTGWISLQSKGLSRVFSTVTVQKHQFFGTYKYLLLNHNSWFE